MMTLNSIIHMISPKGYQNIETLVEGINAQSQEAVKSLKLNGRPLKGLSKSRDTIRFD